MLAGAAAPQQIADEPRSDTAQPDDHLSRTPGMLFEVIGRNGDGYLTREELLTWLEVPDDCPP